MSEFFKSKGRMAGTLLALILVITLLAGGAAYLLSPQSFLGIKQQSEVAVEPPTSQPEQSQEEVVETAVKPEEEPPQIEEAVSFNTPTEMRGVFLLPGVDFLAGKDKTESAVKKEIDKALEEAKTLTMNSVIIYTTYEGGVIYKTPSAPCVLEFDPMDYIVKKSRELGLYTYAIFDASLYSGETSVTTTMALGAKSVSNVSSAAKDFAEKYSLDGILLEGYQNPTEVSSYIKYLNMGGAIGFNNYMRQSPLSIVKTFSDTLRKNARGTQVGLLADAVWQNAAEDESGSNTKAAFTALGSANADTKGFIQAGLVDFVAVKAYSCLTDGTQPFKEVVSWWGGVAKEQEIPLYVIHASDKICTEQEGWQSHDQITKQVIEASGVSGYSGSIFNNLKRLEDNPKEATTTLVKYYNKEIVAAHILTELAVTKPEKTTFTTFEPVVTFTGASDPNSPVTINGVLLKTDASGYFTTTFDLKAGENTFKIEHKEKVLNYKITRQVQILKEISPMGSITTEGGMSITISAVAYLDAKVTATIGGVSIPMEIDDSVEDEQDRDSNYKQFFAQYTAPAAQTTEQNLGNIVVNAVWEGQKDSIKGATVKINKKAKIEDGVPIVVTAAQARTYPPDTLNNIPNSNYFPLPAGAMDYAVGEEIIYKKGSESYSYFVLSSGLRVEAKDIKPTSDYASGNSISALTVKTDDEYTYVILKTSQKVSYNLKYAASGVSIKFNYTNSVPKSVNLDKNPLFTAANWKDNTLTLPLLKQGGFIGYKGYFDDAGNTVLRFNNPPSSIGSARIVVDPGHGGNDIGAKGFLPDYPERVINLAIAQLLADELESRGATVLLLNTSGGMSLEERVGQAERFNADIFVSVHNNTASRASAIGTETYYFYPFSYALAYGSARSVSSQLATDNRGARASYYHVTLSSQFASVLVECGFLSNQSEYEKLIRSGNQQNIATGIADGISAAIKAVYTGSFDAGEQSAGGGVTTTGEGQSGGEAAVESVTLNMDSLNIAVGNTFTLKAVVTPDDAADKSVSWKVGNTSVATVDKNGKVTAISEGTTKVTLTTTSGKKTAVCQIEVLPEGDKDDTTSSSSSSSGSSSSSSSATTTGVKLSDASNIRLNADEAFVAPNKTYSITVLCDEGTIRSSDFVFETDDKTIATVDATGKVTAKKVGKTAIFITSKGEDYGFSCEINVTSDKIPLKAIAFKDTSGSVVKGKTYSPIVVYTPDNASNQKLSWTTSDAKIATVSTSGSIKGVATGTAKITATSTDGGFKAVFEIKVVDTAVSVDNITLNENSLIMEKAGTAQLVATVSPQDVTDATVSWKSSNTAVATVDAKGKVTAIRKGNAVITATSNGDKSFYESCEVVVE